MQKVTRNQSLLAKQKINDYYKPLRKSKIKRVIETVPNENKKELNPSKLQLNKPIMEWV